MKMTNFTIRIAGHAVSVSAMYESSRELCRENSVELVELMPDSSGVVAKEKLFDAMKLLNTINVKVPIKQGDILYKNFVCDGVHLVACRSVKK